MEFRHTVIKTGMVDSQLTTKQSQQQTQKDTSMMHMTIEKITPARAQELLDNYWHAGDKQRPLRPRRIDKYVRIILAGAWGLNHESIAIDDRGNLTDGQHRLHAIIAAGIPVQMSIVWDEPYKVEGTNILTVSTLDNGVPRSVGDNLHMQKYTNSNNTAAACRTILHLAADIEHIRLGSTDTIDAKYVLSVYGDEIEYCMATKAKANGLRSSITVGICAFLIKAAPELKKFYTSLVDGVGLAADDPVYVLRRCLTESNQAGSGGEGMYFKRSAQICLAAMKTVLGEKMTRMGSSRQGLAYFCDLEHDRLYRLLEKCGFIALQTTKLELQKTQAVA